MLSLDEKEWLQLSHAYGAATDIPDLLTQLSLYPSNSDNNSEPFFSLWSSLCHQGDTNTAAYAAVSYILMLADKEPARITFDFLLLPVSIEIARLSGRGPEIPEGLKESYSKAIQEIPRIAGMIPATNMDETMCLSCGAAFAISAGDHTLAEAILELEGEAAAAFLEWKREQ